MKNSLIYLKGIREAVAVTAKEAQEVSLIWENKSIPNDFVINIGKIRFTKSEIKLVIESPDKGQGDHWNDVMTSFYENERSKRAELLAEPPEGKAKILNIFVCLYRTATDSDPPQDILDQAKEIQLQFFKSHPKRTLCDFSLLRELIPKPVIKESLNLWNQWPLRLKDAQLRVIEKAIFRDMQLSGQLKSYYQPPVLEKAVFGETPEEMKNRADRNRGKEDDFNDMVKNATDNF